MEVFFQFLAYQCKLKSLRFYKNTITFLLAQRPRRSSELITPQESRSTNKEHQVSLWTGRQFPEGVGWQVVADGVEEGLGCWLLMSYQDWGGSWSSYPELLSR